MFHPDTPERRERDGRSKKEILLEMKKFCEFYKIKPYKVFDGKYGIYFIFNLPDQKLTEDQIWKGPGMEQIKDFFSKKEYVIIMKKWYYRTSFWEQLKLGGEKVHLFVGLENPGENFHHVIKQKGEEIKFG